MGQFKLAMIGISISVLLVMGWSIKYLYAKTVTQKTELKERAAIIDGWARSYTDLVNRHKRVTLIANRAETQKDEVQKKATALAIALEKEKANDPTKCATTTVPDGYRSILVDGLPSRKAATGLPTTTDGRETDLTDPIP